MSLSKAIEHGKERRKPYRGAKAVDATCRNHGGCPGCRMKREHKDEKRRLHGMDGDAPERTGKERE